MLSINNRMKNTKPLIPAIDLFAGPGGLAEGFSQAGFDVRLSVEMDEHAHQTLRFRSFCRKLIRNQKRQALLKFYEGLAGKKSADTDQLTDQHPDLWKEAEEEALRAELGKDSAEMISDKIEKALGRSSDWLLQIGRAHV